LITASATAASRFATSEVPLYYQLATILREQILAGAYAPGQQIPTEAELVEAYGVSRITVRQALKSLEGRQLIRREAGRGTFVSPDLPLPDSLRMNGSLDDLISMGLATSVRLLDLREVIASRDDETTFGIGAGEKVVQCTRLRLYHDEPYSYIINRLPQHIARLLEAFDWEQGTILKAIEERLGLRLLEAEQSVRATLADATLARALNTRIGAPLLSVDRNVRNERWETVERVHTYYRSDLYSLTVHLTRAGEGDAAAGWKVKERQR
jgi:GntR family transcriptional regulator